jgi:hypothetical protein
VGVLRADAEIRSERTRSCGGAIHTRHDGARRFIDPGGPFLIVRVSSPLEPVLAPQPGNGEKGGNSRRRKHDDRQLIMNPEMKKEEEEEDEEHAKKNLYELYHVYHRVNIFSGNSRFFVLSHSN